MIKGKQEIGDSGNVRWAAQGQSDANGIAQGSGGRFSQGFGFGKEQDSQSSTTRSGIGTRNIQITDAAEQQRRSAQSVRQAAAGIYTDRRTETADATAGYLKNGFDRERVEKELALQQSVTRQFAPVAAQQIANVSDYLGNTRNYQKVAGLKADWEQQLAQAQTPEQQAELQQNIAAANQYLSEHQAAYDLWKEGGIGRSLLHAGSGALLTGGADGALASGSTALAAPYLNEISGKLDGGGKVLFDTLSGAAIGLATGGNTGALAAGANTDWNNRQLHNHEISKIKQIAGEFAAQNNISLQEAEIRLLVEAMRQVDRTYANQHAKADGAAAQFLRYHTGSFNDETGESILEFAHSGYYNDPRKFAEQTGYMTERLIIRDSPTSQPIRGTSYLRLSSDDIKAMGRGLIGKDLPREKSNIRGYVRGITKSVLGNAWYSLSGRQVTVQSNQDLLVRGNSIVSDAGTTLAAGGKIELNAAENHYRNEDTHRARRSGFTFGMRNGVANIGYRQSRSRTTQDNDLTAAVSSRVGSLNGDTVIAAGERIDTRAAQLFAGRDLALQSKEVNLGAAYVQENTRTEYQSSGSGFSLKAHPQVKRVS